MWLKVSQMQARSMLDAIPHKHCQSAIGHCWRVSAQGKATPQAVLWLFCWAKTGQGSTKAADAATRAFDDIFNIPFRRIDAVIDHEWARAGRYRSGNIEQEFGAVLQRGGIDSETR